MGWDRGWVMAFPPLVTGDRRRLNGGQTKPRGTASPPRRPYEAQGTGRAPKGANLVPGDRPRPHGSHPDAHTEPKSQGHCRKWHHEAESLMTDIISAIGPKEF